MTLSLLGRDLRVCARAGQPYVESTIGASFMSKLILVDGAPIKFQIWDTAGQEKYHSLAPMYYKGAAAAIVVRVLVVVAAAAIVVLCLWLAAGGEKQ